MNTKSRTFKELWASPGWEILKASLKPTVLMASPGREVLRASLQVKP